MTYLPVKISAPQAPSAGMGDIFSDAVNAVGSLVAVGTKAAIGLAAPRFTMVSGIAKPNDEATLNLFKALQQQMNRVAAKKKLATIGVDGKIGNDTTTLMGAIVKAANADYQIMGSSEVPKAITGDTGSGWDTVTGIRTKLMELVQLGAGTAQQLATNAIGLHTKVKAYADWLGSAPVVSSPKPAAPPAIYNPTTQLEVAQPASASMLDAWNRLGTATQLAAVAGVLGLGYFAAKKMRKK